LNTTDQFEQYISLLRDDAIFTLDCFRVRKELHFYPATDNELRLALESYSWFVLPVMNALTSGIILGLGRIFDNGSDAYCKKLGPKYFEHISQTNRQKTGVSGNDSSGISIAEICCIYDEKKSIYEQNVKDVRHHIVAHSSPGHKGTTLEKSKELSWDTIENLVAFVDWLNQSFMEILKGELPNGNPREKLLAFPLVETQTKAALRAMAITRRLEEKGVVKPIPFGSL
jgi:hypothetical protein